MSGLKNLLNDASKEDAKDDEMTRVHAVLDWAEDQSWFDDSFVRSLLTRLESGKSLTDKQINAFENIETMVEKNKAKQQTESLMTDFGYNSDMNDSTFQPFDPDDIPF